MKIAVFSDMHGNALALEAMLADVRGEAVDQMVCLGDAIQGGPQPAQVVTQLRTLGCPVVMGNADDWLITGQDSGAENIPEARRRKMDAVREWQLSKLNEADMAFIKTFKPTIELPLDRDRKLLCFHGSPRSFDDVILPLTPDEEARRFLEPQQNTIYTGGHTHVQFIRHFGRTFHFNPGSVGFPFRHDQPEDSFHNDPWAEYAILTVEGGQVALTFRRVPIDARALIGVYRNSGRPFAEEAVAQYEEGD